MKPNSNNKKVITLYLKQLKTTLMCSASMKKVILSDVKHQISELEDQLQVLEEKDLHREIGSPDEIARGFESRDDIENLKKKAKKYSRTKIICWVSLILAIVAITVSIVVVHSNKKYHSEINMNTYIKETK